MHISKIINMLNRWDTLSEFVKKVCQGRDDSHGHMHMRNVACTSLAIMEESYLFSNIQSNTDINEDDVINKIITVAWLHDVADYKYDKDGNLKMQLNEFLITLYNEIECDSIMKIVDMISYSKENKALETGIKIDYVAELGYINNGIRDIVSDADKLEAIGKHGLERCIMYTRHAHINKHGTEMPIDMLKSAVQQHANEKLLRLKDEFIRTSGGLRLAEKLHTELIDELNKM